MSDTAAKLRLAIERLKDEWSPTELDLIERVARDLVALTARKLQGEEVRTELRHVHAQAAALFAASSLTVKDVLLEELRGFLVELGHDLIPGL